MIKKFLFTLFICSLALISKAQSTHDVMVGGGMDLIKTDINTLFKKAQFGFEALAGNNFARGTNHFVRGGIGGDGVTACQNLFRAEHV